MRNKSDLGEMERVGISSVAISFHPRVRMSPEKFTFEMMLVQSLA